MKQQVNLEIMQFVETQILPKYTEFGESHGLRHVTRVIKNALKLVPVYLLLLNQSEKFHKLLLDEAL